MPETPGLADQTPTTDSDLPDSRPRRVASDEELGQSPSTAVAISPASRHLTPLIVFFVALAIVGYFVFTAVDGVINNNSIGLRAAAIQTEISDLAWEAEQLSALVAFLDSDEYIERTAREDLGFVRVGEEAFAIEAPIQVGLPITRSPWWANLLPVLPQPDAE
jgi:cell division protein FtsB